jgi:prepilin-type N-terminal cleavage/methylation domain-containing protein
MRPRVSTRAGHARRGFTMVEMVIVIVILGILTAVGVTRLRETPRQAADGAARRVVQDIELARTRAYASRTAVRLVVDDTSYRFFLDADRDSAFTESAAERDAYGSGAERLLDPRLRFGRGTLPAVPGDTTTFVPGTPLRFRFDRRGIPEPFGATFTLYVGHTADARSASALTVTAAGNVRLWTFTGGAWR